jgi:plastocyanin
VTFDKVGLIKLFCNIHSQMFGAILVLPTTYFSTTAADGTFTIPEVPAGDYTVKIWHELQRGAPQTASVTAGGTVELAFTLQPKRRDR